MASSLATCGTVAPPANLASASRSLRMICSGECRLPIKSPPSTALEQPDSHSSWISFRGAGHRLLSVVPVVSIRVEGGYAGRCLLCGTRGPVRADGEAARGTLFEKIRRTNQGGHISLKTLVGAQSSEKGEARTAPQGNVLPCLSLWGPSRRYPASFTTHRSCAPSHRPTG